jgi:hypothetical protein
MFDFSFGERLQCSDSDKKECMKTVKTILDLSEKSRKYGLLALEEDLKAMNSFFMKKGIEFLTDGIDPQIIRTVLGTYLITGGYRGKELLERTAIMEGLLAIQSGENPMLIRERLAGLFGEEYYESFNDYFSSKKVTVQEYLEEIKDKGPYSEETALLEEPFHSLNDRSLQRLLRELNNEDLIYAMKYASGSLQKRIFDNLSDRLADMIKEDINRLKDLSLQTAKQSQLKIIGILSQLKNNGEIA